MSWAGLASDQWVSFSDLANAIEEGIFMLRDGFSFTASERFISGDDAFELLYIQDPGLTADKFITKGEIIASTDPGESFEGGLVAYKDYDAGLEQYFVLIITNNDFAAKPWYNGSYGSTGTSSSDNGFQNTEDIIYFYGSGDYAAYNARAYDSAGYGDWYLPSKAELDLIYNNKVVLGLSEILWSSNDSSINSSDEASAKGWTGPPNSFHFDKAYEIVYRPIRKRYFTN